MTFNSYSAWLSLAAVLVAAPGARAQINPISAEPPAKLVLKAGTEAAAKVAFKLAPGYHTNSNTPADEFLIPLRLTWESAPIAVKFVEYPKPHMEKYAFSDKPLSVFTGAFTVTTRFQAAADAPKGPRTLTGKLRYQACTDSMCLPPRTLTVQLQAEIQ